MDEGLRQSGLGVVGDMPWGIHFCQFNETDDDIVETSVPYLRL
jgi:hypothetical protein